MKMIDYDNAPAEKFMIDLSKQDCPVELLCNWMDIDTFALTSGDGTTFIEKDWFRTIWQKISTVMDYRYHYFRADMEFAISIFSTPTDYGAFVISWNPESLTLGQDNFDALNANPWIFDISSGGTHIIHIPYSSNYKGYNSTMMASASGFASSNPKIYYIPLPYAALGSALGASVTVRGRFCNMKAWGSLGVATNLTMDEAVSQMDLPTRIDPESLNAVSEVATAVNTARTYYNIAGGAFTAVTLGGGTLYNKFYGAPAPIPLQAKMDEDPGYPPGFGPDAPAKDDGAVRNEPTFYGDMTSLKGCPAENMSFSMTPISKFGLAENTSHMIKRMMQIPCIYHVANLAASTSLSWDVCPLEFGSQSLTARHADYLGQMSQFFRFWRGSIDYRFKFHLSPMMTVRVLIEAFNKGSEKTNTPTNPAYLFKEILELTGFSEKCIRVPFIFDFEWCKMEAQFGGTPGIYYTMAPTTLMLTVQSIAWPSIGSASTPAVPIIVVRNAGPDFQVRNLVGCNIINSTPAPPVESQMRIRAERGPYEDIFKGNSGVHPPRPVMEDKMTVEDMCRRWSVRQLDSNPIDPLRPFGGTNVYTVAPAVDLFDYLTNMFRYVRGSVDFRIPVPSSFSGTTMWARMEPDLSAYTSTLSPVVQGVTSSGYAITVSGLNPVLNCEFPLESYADWLTTYGSVADPRCFVSPLRVDIGPDVSPTSAYVRGGKSFQLAYLHPPIFLKYWPRYIARPTPPPFLSLKEIDNKEEKLILPKELKDDSKGKELVKGWFR